MSTQELFRPRHFALVEQTAMSQPALAGALALDKLREFETVVHRMRAAAIVLHSYRQEPDFNGGVEGWAFLILLEEIEKVARLERLRIGWREEDFAALRQEAEKESANA